MRNHKPTVLLIALLVIVTATATATIPPGREPQSSTDKRKVDARDQAPVAVFNEQGPANPEERAKRLEKGKRYDGQGVVIEQTSGLNVSPRSAHWTQDVPAIPSTQSDVVVVGQIVEAKAYLSNDKTGVYSEFAVRIDELLKTDGRAAISNNRLMVERVGGSVRFPSGRVQRINVRYGQRMPQVGGRYLLFLKFAEGTQDLSILTGYELADSRVSALDNIEPYTANDGSEEFGFLEQVRTSINSTAAETPDKRRQNQ